DAAQPAVLLVGDLERLVGAELLCPPQRRRRRLRPCPGFEREHPQGIAPGVQRHCEREVAEKPVARATKTTKISSRRSEAELRGVVYREHFVALRNTADGCADVRLKQRRRSDCRIAQKPITSLLLSSSPEGDRQRCIWPGSHPLGHRHRAALEPLVTQVDGDEFVRCV